ncbi:MAG: hypothetical protein HY319_18500 [Armatimonadetes bacterium]|nr:hypothetical protein [Armatimonadota bacterium]
MRQLEWVPVFCRNGLTGGGQTAIRSFLPQARLELRRMQQQRRELHAGWSCLHLARREAFRVREAIACSQLQLEHLEQSLEHLEQFLLEDRREDVQRALIRWEASERAFRSYTAVRMALDPVLLDRMLQAS